MTTETTDVVLTADVSQYQQGIDQANQQTQSFLTTLERLGTAADNALKQTGRNMMITSAGMVASMTAMGAAAGNLDSKMAQLSASAALVNKGFAEKKTMDDYKGAISSLRTEFGTTATEAIALVQQLNKLGQSSKDVERIGASYTRLGAVVGESVSLLSQEMVTLQRQMGNNQGVRSTEHMNATLAELSQNAGVSATSIAQFSNAIAPIGRAVGMSTKEVAGFSTAFVKAGADGFAATTAFNRMITDITRSIQYGSPDLNAYANLIGVSTENFKELAKTNPAEPIIRVFEEINKQGPSAIKTLERFGLDGVRMSRSVQAVASQAGGLRSAVNQAVSGGDVDNFNEAGDVAFKGLNDELRKTGELTKQIGENFGQGILPYLEGTAKAINAILRPVNELLKALDKIPGGSMAVGAGALALGGFALKSISTAMGLGAVAGPAYTAVRGWRGGRALGDLTGQRFDALGRTDAVALGQHVAWRGGAPLPGDRGNLFQHALYGATARMGEAYQRGRDGIGSGAPPPGSKDPLPYRGMKGMSRLSAMGINFLSRMGVATLDPLTPAAQNDLFGGRSQDAKLFTRSYLSDYFKGDVGNTITDGVEAAKQSKVGQAARAAGAGMVSTYGMFTGKTGAPPTPEQMGKKTVDLSGADQFADAKGLKGIDPKKLKTLEDTYDNLNTNVEKAAMATAAETASKSKNTAATNTQTTAKNAETSAVRAGVNATTELSIATGKAAGALSSLAAKGFRQFLPGDLSLGGMAKGAVSGIRGGLGMMIGNPVGAAMTAGMVGMWAYNQHEKNKAAIKGLADSTENTSPLGVYQSALGEAASATKTFAERVLEQADLIGPRGFTPKVTESEKDRAQREQNTPYMNNQIRDANSVEHMQTLLDSMVLGGASDAVMSATKSDLLKRYGTTDKGIETVERLLTNATGIRDREEEINVTTLFDNILGAQADATGIKFWQKGTIQEDTTAAIDSAAKTMQALTQYASTEDAAQANVALFNQMFDYRKSELGALTREGNAKALAAATAQYMLGPNMTDEDVNLIKIAFGGSIGSVERAQQYIIDNSDLSNTDSFGYVLDQALRTVDASGGSRTSRTLPSHSIAAGMDDPWEFLLDASVNTRLRGGTVDGVRSQVTPGASALYDPEASLSVEGRRTSDLLQQSLDQPSNANLRFSAMQSQADYLMNLSKDNKFGMFAGAVDELMRIQNASDEPTDPSYQRAADSIGRVRQLQSERMATMMPWERTREVQMNYQQAQEAHRLRPGVGTGMYLEDTRAQRAQVEIDLTNQLRSLLTQRREFDISKQHSQEDFGRQRQWSLDDFNKSVRRAWEDFYISRERAEYDFNLQRQYQEEDFHRSRKHQQEDYDRSRRHAYEDFNRSRRRSEEDFQHQVMLMTEQTARQMTNIYERINVQRTWSTENLLQNMRDQQGRADEMQTNLERLRKAGLSGDAINMLGLNEFGNHQQLARFADDVLSDPSQIDAFNRMVKDRTKSASAIVTDENSVQWREMQRNFNLSMDRGQEDFDISMGRMEENYRIQTGRQNEMYQISTQRQVDNFSRQMKLSLDDMNRMMSRNSEDFYLNRERQFQEYTLSMERAEEAFQRSHTIIEGSFHDLANASLEILSGSAKTQLQATIEGLNDQGDAVKKTAREVVRDIDRTYAELGIVRTSSSSGNLHSGGGGGGGGKYAMQTRAEGGVIEGYSPHPKADNVPIWATAGEFMQPVDAVEHYGKGFHEAVRTKSFPKELAEGYANGGLISPSRLIAFGKNLQSRGFSVGEHPAFGGVRGRHAPTSMGGLHYIGHAIDVNADHFPEGEARAIDKLVASQIARRLYGLRTTWRWPGHFGHAHFDTRRGPDRGKFVGSTGYAWSGEGSLEDEIRRIIGALESVKEHGRSMSKAVPDHVRVFGGNWLRDELVKATMELIDPYVDDPGTYGSDISELKRLAQRMAAGRGWVGDQWKAIDWIVQRESSWNPKAQNPTSTAYGLFQFLDQTWSGVGGRKTSDPAKQIEYGLQYIANRYKTPLAAQAFWKRNNWYGDGAMFTGPAEIGVGERGPEAVIPLNEKGVNFLSEVMKKNATDSQRAMVMANGVPQHVNTTNYYQKIDKGSHFHGDITVKANDPNEFIRQMEAKKRDDAMKGRAPR